MAKTYTAAGTVAAGDVATAAAWNVVTADVNNLIVPPAARIQLTSNVSVSNNDWTNFTGFTSTNASEDYDTDGMVTLSASASAITVQTAGIYLVTASVIFTGNATGFRAAQVTRQTGASLFVLGASALPTNVAGVTSLLSVSGVGSFSASDLIRLRVVQNSGGALNMQAVDVNDEYARTQLTATWIGRTA